MSRTPRRQRYFDKGSARLTLILSQCVTIQLRAGLGEPAEARRDAQCMNMPEIPFFITFAFIIFPALASAAALLYYRRAMRREKTRKKGSGTE